MSPKPLIGIVDDERNIQATLAAILERRGYGSASAFTGRQGLQMIAEHKPDVLLLDLGLPDGEGLDLLRTIRLEHPALPVIVVTANDSLNNAIASIKIGAFHFISKPYVPDELLSLVAKALESRGLKQETVQLREETERLKKRVQRAEAQLQPIFKNVKMRELFELVEQIAPSEANVLVVGESGVGKEIFANRIHELSPRAEGPLIKLNCAAFPQNMIEGELFGYKKGAFTGASQDFPGMLSAAAGGTLFLDEIAEMPIDLQTRFLRVLQEREFRPLGSTQVIKADFRLVAASNRRPEDAIRAGRLREDLFYRLNTFTLPIPPLRERTEDIPELAQVFLQRFCAKMNKPLLTIQSEAYDALLRYRWPGNVRELQNVIERAVVLTTGSMITRRNLPHEVVHGAPSELGAPGFATSELSDSPPQVRALLTDSQSFNLAEREKAALMAALDQCNGNKKKAAELLGIHRPTLYTKLKKFGLGA
ncbi:MAG: sigma-54 dependent transcriptional regulator [Methylacidiphilales bacterium]|nr:sigma-54 dependent transcriptional regulator [Candidatus Methylacidiphilales bacterium]